MSSNNNTSVTRKNRRLDELARIEFVGSLSEAFGRFAWELREVSERWDAELGLSAADARKALVSMRGRLGLDAAARRVKARRVARRLRRAQTLAASIGRRAERFPKEYAKNFLTPEAAKHIMTNGGGSQP